MKENLVIVESPAKAKTIEKFLGDDYRVMSSYGHIRDLKKKSFSIDEQTFEPQYEIPADKAKLVAELKKKAAEAKVVWLASDEDREGEAISWHLSEVLGLNTESTRRIVFHEITKNAILEAIEHPRTIDLNLVNAQQARRVLDRIVGFKLSPLLWRKVKPALSAGRVQSVAVRLIVEKEREVNAFKGDSYFRLTALFQLPETGDEMKAELNHRFATREEAQAFLERCKDAEFSISNITTKPIKRSPFPPFTTSTLQQEAAHKLGFTVAQTMSIAQRLYESGRITYMRTDSVNLSSLCLNASKKVIAEQMGEEYVKTRNYHTSAKGAQEAHEAIRPTYMEQSEIEATPQEKRLYDLIWKRTIASQMADAELEKTTVTISINANRLSLNGSDDYFVANGEVVKFDGFRKVYRDDNDSDNDNDSENPILPSLTTGLTLGVASISATQRYSMRPARYNEASLVHKLEELGIGRPSTYASTITTIQQREYVSKSDKPGEQLPSEVMTLKGGQIKHSTHKMVIGAERGRLVPTDTGTVVNDFLQEFFPEIMDYNFTADVEKDFDEIAEGKKVWEEVIKDFYNRFNPLVEKSVNTKSEHRVGERILGSDPKTGKQVSVKIGRFGPVAQIGVSDDKEKPRFAQLKKTQSLETITLDEALELFQLPRELGEFEGKMVTIGAGKYGPYVQHDGKYVSIPKTEDPLTMGIDQAVLLIEQKRKEEAEKHMRVFPEDPDMEILRGRFGAYLLYKEKNYHLSKAQQAEAMTITYEELLAVVEAQDSKPQTTTRRRFAKK
ncbi:MAG: type I DNA topoisomerase [Bacteroidales bacterium]|nr:type I DNA topoisomerase [Candidatus Physcousia equi]